MNDRSNSPNQAPLPPAQVTRPAEIDPTKLEEFMRGVRDRQNLILGSVAGIGAAVLGAILWAIITFVTDYQIGWMAIGVGFLVGLAVRQFGKGVDRIYGITGAILSLAGCLAGNLLAVLLVIAREESVPLLNALMLPILAPGVIVEIFKVTFSPIDLLFYGIAIYEGYKVSFRRISQQELAGLMKGAL